MRKLVYAINVSIDGCCDHTKMVPDEDLFDYYIQLLRGFGLFVYGRKTYQLMVPYWPDVAKDPASSKSDMEFGQVFASKNIVVFSRTLNSNDDGKTRITRGDLREEILRLKQEPGEDILAGGVDIPSQLIQLDLVDELRIVVAPVVVGKGRRLFEDMILPASQRLKLVESKVFESGCVALRYSKQ
jgi:dihydrofolate reductase